jgi:hypothetical protein
MFIMGYLKFTLTFLLELIKKNIIKTIFIIVAIIFFHYADTLPDSIDTYKIVAETKVENTYIYVYETISDNKVKYNNIWQEGKPLIIKDGVIKLPSYNGFNILFWVISVISVVVLGIATFVGIGDDDIGWGLEDAWKEAFSTLIYCEEENGEFYYFALGRLISKKDRQISAYYNACRELSIGGFRDLYRCPKYQTKTQRRETLLNKIGIN